MAGSQSDLHKDSLILAINSPKSRLKGPYRVIYKKNTTNEFWALVAINWDGEPRLAMRWFYGKIGSPSSSGYPTWFIIPPSITKTLLAGLPLNHALTTKIDEFLSGKISGPDLNKEKGI